MNDGGYRYELTCEAGPEYEQQYHNVMADAVIQWFSIDGLAGFRPLSEIDGEAVRLQFEFDDQRALEEFVTTPEHREAVDALRSVCRRVESHRWQPGAVSLAGD